jgi:predicted membrane protein
VSIPDPVEEHIGERRFEIRIAKQDGWRTVQAFEGATPATQCYAVEEAEDFSAEVHGSAVKYLVQLVREELQQRAADGESHAEDRMSSLFNRLKRPVRVLNFVLGFLAPLYAGWVIYSFATKVVGSESAVFHLVLWSIGPPAWFFIEHNVLLEANGSNLDRLKSGQEVAGRIWAAVLAVILFFYPNGLLEDVGKLVDALGK